MPDEAELPPLDPRMVDVVREAIARGVPHGFTEPVDKPPVLSGRDAALIREVARQMVDERLRDRRLLSDVEIKAVARDIAHEVFERKIRDVTDDMRTEKEIEAIIVAKLREIGLRADEEHKDETRDSVTGLFRGQKRRAEMGGEFVKEVIKALAGYGAAGMIGAAGVWMMTKGGPH